MRQTNVVNMLYGSHLYGLSTPASDTDFAGIYMPTMEEVLLQKAKKATSKSTGDDHSKNSAEDEDVIMFSLPQFVEMALKGDTTALDMLHCDTPITSSWIWEELHAQRKRFYSKNMKAYVGYVKSQAMKYGLKGDKVAELRTLLESLRNVDDRGDSIGDIWDSLPEGEYLKKRLCTNDVGVKYYEILGKKYQDTNMIAYVLGKVYERLESYGHRSKQAADNEGMDWKALSHALRVAYQVRAVLENGDFHYPLAESEFIKRVKAGEASYGEEIAPELDKLLDYITEMTDSSDLPAKPDEDYWNKWLMDVYTRYYNIRTRDEP